MAGVGNIFFGDDGFGVEVARRLAALDLPDWARKIANGYHGGLAVTGEGVVRLAGAECRYAAGRCDGMPDSSRQAGRVRDGFPDSHPDSLMKPLIHRTGRALRPRWIPGFIARPHVGWAWNLRLAGS